jgi:RimJ/RimL family protein N-acetyltransferase
VIATPISAPVLTTSRLELRMLQQSDFEQYAAIHADPEVTHFTTRTHLDRADAWRHLALIVGHWHLRGFGMWGVFEKETDALVGRVGFHEPDNWPGFELAWTIGRAFWGRGYAPEAARRCLEFAFDEMKRSRVISLIDPANANSIRVAEKLGEVVEGEATVGGHRLLVYAVEAGGRKS